MQEDYSCFTRPKLPTNRPLAPAHAGEFTTRVRWRDWIRRMICPNPFPLHFPMVPSATTTRRRPALRCRRVRSRSRSPRRRSPIALDGELRDLSDPLRTSGRIEIVTREDPRALELIRHDTAHVLAEAVQELWPGTQVTIGPVIENGFYYDFARNEPFTPEDFPVIEKKMREIIAAQQALHQGGLAARQGATGVSRQGRDLQGRTGRRDSRRSGPEDLLSGRLVRPLPRAAYGLHRPDRQRLQADEGGRRLLARRFQQSDADAHLRHGLGRPGSSSTSICICWRKRRSATIAGSAARWTCSISRKRGRASSSGMPRAGGCSRS